MSRYITKRLLSSILVLIAIVYLSMFVQTMAHYTSAGESISILNVAVDAAQGVVEMALRAVTGQLGTFYNTGGTYMPDSTEDLGEALVRMFQNSAGLLLVAMSVGGFLGVLIGAIAAASKHKGVSAVVLFISIVGISTPSFFLAMVLQIAEIAFYKNTGVRLVPVGGFGWDSHMILPVMVLAARPIAQVARLSYVAINDILSQDYVRTAEAKGLGPHRVWLKHILTNAVGTIFVTLATSLRLALSSLPVVETVFSWPGAGVGLLELLQTGQVIGASLMVFILGGAFILINLSVDILQHVLDPRLAEEAAHIRLKSSWSDWFCQVIRSFWSWLTFRRWRERRAAHQIKLASFEDIQGANQRVDKEDQRAARIRTKARRDAWIRATAGNASLIVGLIITALLLVVVLFGTSISPHDPYDYQLFIEVNGESVVPPMAPSETYLLGTDAQGRDILSLLLSGAGRTLSIALFAVVIRMLIGCLLGFLAGWYSDSRLDRFIIGLGEAFSAFPGLLLAMLIVYGLGVQEGMSSFIIALAAVGWADVMQAVRSEVSAIRPMAYIEGAVANGLTEGQILSSHVLPNVWPKIISLAFLEMGGVLMLLGELGFLGVFIGGGRAASGDSYPSVIYYNVPEWSVMLANSWKSIRSAPWSALYPAAAFFIAIMGFTYLGEGLRQVSEKLTLSMRTLFNRYTLLVAVIIGAGVYWMFDANSYATHYSAYAKAFSEERAMEDIAWLTDESLNGRLSGSEEANEIAESIAQEFRDYGLQPGGENETYYQEITAYYRNLVDTPTLVFTGPNGEVIEGEYGVDFVRDSDSSDAGGYGTGDLVVISPGGTRISSRDAADDAYNVTDEEIDREDKVVLWLGDRYSFQKGLGYISKSGMISLGDESDITQLFELPTSLGTSLDDAAPSVYVTLDFMSEVMDVIGYDLQMLIASSSKFYLDTGWQVTVTVPVEDTGRIEVRNVIGLWPGEDVLLGHEAIIISAYYDGLGRDENGELLPGANDNASGIATMLEVLRTMAEQDFKPQRTIIFVAWAGGERGSAVNYERFLEAHPGFDTLEILGAFELEGVGAGSGQKALISLSTRNALTEIVQDAARKVGVKVTASGSGLHSIFSDWLSPSEDVALMILSWDGADEYVHTPQDTYETIDPDKIGAVGRLTTLSVMMLATDPSY